jgi:hypothetical protein
MEVVEEAWMITFTLLRVFETLDCGDMDLVQGECGGLRPYLKAWRISC